MSYVKTKDNVNLYVKDWGQGRPVILMHGWPLSADTFDDLSMAIATAGLRAIAYDRRVSDAPINLGAATITIRSAMIWQPSSSKPARKTRR